VLLLATAAFGGDQRRRFRRFWLGVAGISFLWMLGGYTPFFQLIYLLVPGTKFFRAPSTIVFVFAFAIAVFAALGTERILARQVTRRFVFGWLAFGGVVALLASAGVVTSIAESGARAAGVSIAARQGVDPQYAPQVAEQFASRANANAGDVVLGAWRSFLFVALAAALLLAYLRGALAARVAGIALALIAGTDLWSIARQYWLFSPPARTLYAADPAVDFLKRQPQPGRVLVRALSDSGLAHPDPFFGGDGVGTGTGLMVHGIRSLTGYQGNAIGRYEALEDAPMQGGMPGLMAPTFWRHENAQYLYTNAALGDSALKLLVGPVKNAAGSTVYLYRLPGENPYAWLAPTITKAGDGDVQAAVLDPRFDPARVAVFDTSAAVAAGRPSVLPERLPIMATTTAYGPGRASVRLSAPAPAGSALLVSENYFPGWSATVDGRVTPAYRADFNLIGVPLPAGARAIDLSFRDPALSVGKGITVFASLIALLGLAAGLVADRRARRV
jgi:hypothetical protein